MNFGSVRCFSAGSSACSCGRRTNAATSTSRATSTTTTTSSSRRSAWPTRRPTSASGPTRSTRGSIHHLRSGTRTGTCWARNDEQPDRRAGPGLLGLRDVLPEPPAGDYYFSIACFDNFANGNTIGDGFLYDGDTPIPMKSGGPWERRLEPVAGRRRRGESGAGGSGAGKPGSLRASVSVLWGWPAIARLRREA